MSVVELSDFGSELRKRSCSVAPCGGYVPELPTRTNLHPLDSRCRRFVQCSCVSHSQGVLLSSVLEEGPFDFHKLLLYLTSRRDLPRLPVSASSVRLQACHWPCLSL
jgi:hypothetical protein